MFFTVYLSVGLVLLALSLPPFVSRIRHIGVLLPAAQGLCMVSLAAVSPLLQPCGWWAAAQWVLLGFLLLEGLLFLAGSLLLCCFPRYRHGGNDSCIVVLGCRVRGQIPSKMLARRLQKAHQLLVQNPHACCVVTGGQGEDEEVPEAEVMAAWLAQRGIDAERIYREDCSRSTRQNLQFAAQIIEQQDLPRRVIVVSDFYHLARGCIYARRFDLLPCGAACRTNPAMIFGYWAREVPAIFKALLGR
ncbi:YdcF family protein [Neobittarella massiliensis]|uniref:YdcF family protein n=1 Tax=Neobittarella massiliensis (ex Bilen et al. 2018) TaxID=2041842 RepID=UPI000CF74702|nr:YdcF family protein [Neobittarella massiliensis]